MSIEFSEFFSKFNLTDLKQLFVDNDFRNVEGLFEVTNDDLIEMGVTKLGLRKSFLGALKKVKGESITNMIEGTPNKFTPDHMKMQDEKHSERMTTKTSIQENSKAKTCPDFTTEIQDQNKSDIEQSTLKKDSTAIDYSTPCKPREPTKKRLFSPVHKSPACGEQKLITDLLCGSPSSYPKARRIGVRIYSPTEIQRAKGYEKLRLNFHNEISEKVANDGLTKTEIVGLADFEWRLRKTILISDNAANFNSVSVIRNVERMNKAAKKVREHAQAVGSARDKGKHILARHLEENDLQKYYVELKKSQDAAVKAIKRAEEKTKEIEEDIKYDLSDLSEDDVEECIREVKRKKDVYEFDE